MTERERLLQAVDASRMPRGSRDLGSAAGFHPGEATKVKRLLRELVREGVLVRDGRTYRRAGTPMPRAERAPAPARRGGGDVTGLLTLRPEGYGFVKRLTGPPGDDVFLPPHELRGTIDGDRIRIRIVPGKFGRDAGQLLEILERRRTHLVGTYRSRGRDAFVSPTDRQLPPVIPVTPAKHVRDGQVVKVAITSEPGRPLAGEVDRVVGEPGDPLPEVLSIAFAHGFAEEFPGRVLAEAKRVPAEVTAADRAGRRDLRALRLVTIDGEDARDFDDAVFVERTASGYRLVVAIADVAHYVTPGTALDDEALHRATSVYFPNHVLPMLPERLSNGICSLNPDVERLCMVCDLALDATGKPLEAELYEAVMRSHARCTYTQVAALLAGEKAPALARVEGDLVLAGELASKLRARRMERGAIDFDLPEAKVVLDEKLQPVDVVKRERNDAHRLVEEFMLAANEAVARTFAHRDLPTVFRVHGAPDPEKLEKFAALARSQGFALDVERGLSPRALATFLEGIAGSPQQGALNALLLRAMMQAVYTPDNIGHYGLAAEHYLHFTSPIRRYPDLLVHRLLKEHWARAGRVPKGGERDRQSEELEEKATHASERERAAMEAEREVEQYFKCVWVKDRVGERSGATITAVTDFGFFAELEEHAVDGLVAAEELGTSWELDEDTHRLVFGSGLSFGIGERVRVEIAGVDLVKRQIHLALVIEDIAQVGGRRRGERLKELVAVAAPQRRRHEHAPRHRPHAGGHDPRRKGKPSSKPGPRTGKRR